MGKKVFFYNSGQRHNAYEQMIANAPGGFRLVPSEHMALGGGGSCAPEGAGGGIQKALRPLLPALSPAYNAALIYLNRPKIRKFAQEGYDLVHSCQSLLDTEYPWVVDFEHAATFSGFNQFAFYRKGFVNALRRKLLDKKLSKLISWSEAAKASLLNFVDSPEIREKTETVYAVVSPPRNAERKAHSGTNFLFVGKRFYEKGGMETLLAFEKISGKYDCRLRVVSSVPEEVKARFGKSGKVEFLEGISHGNLEALYLESDALVFPTHFDTFGFVIAEAFSYGLPVISVDSFSTPELVEDGKTGLVVKSPYSSFLPNFAYRYPTSWELSEERKKETMSPAPEYVDSLAGSMARILEDGELRGRLSENARAEALEGKFSPKVWKPKMKRIYEEALRK